MKFLRRFSQRKAQKPASFSLVDIGRDTVKAVVILVIPGTPEPQIVGYGLAETGGCDIAGGRLGAAAVINPVNTALSQAEDSTEKVVGQKIVPDDVIFAVAGRATVGELFTVRQTRLTPAAPISVKELNHLRARAERLARQGLARLPIEGGHWQALGVTDAGVRLDEHLVLDGVGLTGQNLTFSVFGVAGQAGALRALELLANRLDLTIANIVAAWQALAAVAPYAEAVVLDVGFSGTDICLIRDDALVAAKWIPLGGEFFTLSLAQAMEIEPGEAKKLKHALSNGYLSQDEVEQAETFLDEAYGRWYDAVMELLTESSGERPLPRRIYLTGGGSLLPGLGRLLRADPTPFHRAPEVAWLSQHLPSTVKDLTEGLDYNLFSLALSLTVGVPE
jgi:cell division ATPase FtsA